MTRVVKAKDGVISVDPTGKADGRGCYVCCKDCLAKCKKSRLLNRAFKCEVKTDVYEKLEGEFE